jgi:hypothetical protein
MKVRIFQPSKNAMQSGRGNVGKNWVLEYEVETRRQPEPLMGWTESGDTLNQVRLKFQTAEDAVAYATAKGWDYSVSTPQERRVVPRNYTDNFKYIPPEDKSA